ncbi:hypothetical protein [Micromonospora sp. HUAS LYJ1]|uniref:hypothetical protein n=1 Tax=Micromonospora sp. HUAS LYJ1 TaxID=3061626 RepID=UPI0034A03C8D
MPRPAVGADKEQAGVGPRLTGGEAPLGAAGPVGGENPDRLGVEGEVTVTRPALGLLSIRVELVSGRGEDYWPRPGRILTAARSHTFEQLGTAIDLAFAPANRSWLVSALWDDA